MSADGRQQHPQYQQQEQRDQSEAERQVRSYMLGSEEISYTLRFRPVGVVNWLKSLFGFGVTHWFVTNQRVIEQTKIGGGFSFRDVPYDKISSVQYASKLSLSTIALGVLLVLGGAGAFLAADVGAAPLVGLGVGLLLIGYAYWRRRQVLAIRASGGVSFTLDISKGQQVDDFIWYLHAERQKHTT